MASDAGHAGIMVARITDVVRVRIGTGRRPRGRRMTVITLRRCNEVTGARLTCRVGTVVTAAAHTHSLRTVDPGSAQERCSGMAEMTIKRRCYVWRVRLGVHTDRRRAIMTGRAIVHDTGMIKHGTDKRSGVMADTAILAGRHMTDCLSDRKHIIVARDAAIDDACVTEHGRQEAGGQMTDTAVLVGRHMIRRRCFARCGDAVMTGSTVIDNTRVIEAGADKRCRVMTDRTVFRGRHMGQ